MPPKQEKTPKAQDQIAAAGEAALQAAIQAPAFRFVKFTRTRRIMKRNQQRANLWLWSPGTLVFSRSADWELTDNAKARGIKLDDEFVKRIAVGHFENDEETIYIWATDANDPDGFEISRDKDIMANIADYFFLHRLVRPAGVKEKFDLLPAGQAIEGGPALCFHMNKPTAKGTFETTRKKKTSEPGKPEETK